MNIRSLLFWTYDFLINRGKVRKNYSDIFAHLAQETEDASEVLRLNKLLTFAIENVPYYRHLNSLHVERGGRKIDLLEFPVVNKAMIKDNIESFVAQGVDKAKLRKVTTSGSTGTPFAVFHDKIKRNRHTADNLFFMHFAGYSMGTPLYYMRVWNKYCRHGRLNDFLSNIHPVEIGNLSEEAISMILSDIEKCRGRKSLLAFASTYEMMCRFFRDKGIEKIDANVDCIISMSEHLSEDTRKELQRIFNAPVVSRYSNMENGFIAQQPHDKEYYILNNASYKVELLALDADVPVGLNQLGRIVVTDYYNFAMPLIRYDTGDLGVFQRKTYNGKDVIVLASVEGRRSDMILKTDGSYASPHVITNSMWPYHTLNQWQFIQIDNKNYKFVFNGRISEQEQAELEKTLRGYLGSDAEFVYEYVDDIPVLSSGKRKMIVNLMK